MFRMSNSLFISKLHFTRKIMWVAIFNSSKTYKILTILKDKFNLLSAKIYLSPKFCSTAWMLIRLCYCQECHTESL